MSLHSTTRARHRAPRARRSSRYLRPLSRLAALLPSLTAGLALSRMDARPSMRLPEGHMAQRPFAPRQLAPGEGRIVSALPDDAPTVVMDAVSTEVAA